jgi:hypothetical protein
MSRYDGPFINYKLIDDIERIVDQGVLQEVTDDPTYGDRHLSQLYKLVQAMDPDEIYTIIKSAVDNHKEIVQKSLDYINTIITEGK